ncbi:MAG TPA: helix-turn-helix domain-containing protein [Gaiellaceae bacterium]|nr:helix-turn-helix domain-containing protein [Gaiellaceae bacterium]
MFEIGNSLREARVRQGLGYSEVELATKIRAKYIRALEEEDFDVLPSETYARGFLRAYAEQLGLDGQLYVDEFASRFGSVWREDQPHRPQSRVYARRGVERRAVALALAGIAVLVVLVFVAWKFGGASPSTPSVVPPATPSVAPELALRGLSGGTYVEVRRNSRDGKVLLQATVPRGGTEKLTGTRFYLYVRRPQGLRVTLGGKPVALPSGRNLRVVVTPEQTIRLSG